MSLRGFAFDQMDRQFAQADDRRRERLLAEHCEHGNHHWYERHTYTSGPGMKPRIVATCTVCAYCYREMP